MNECSPMLWSHEFLKPSRPFRRLKCGSYLTGFTLVEGMTEVVGEG
jgi:hypothetical protein